MREVHLDLFTSPTGSIINLATRKGTCHIAAGSGPIRVASAARATRSGRVRSVSVRCRACSSASDHPPPSSSARLPPARVPSLARGPHPDRIIVSEPRIGALHFDPWLGRPRSEPMLRKLSGNSSATRVSSDWRAAANPFRREAAKVFGLRIVRRWRADRGYVSAVAFG
jgi:hypothetical protein